MGPPCTALEAAKGEAANLAGRLRSSESQADALQLAVQAAEQSMRALKLASDPAEKLQLSATVSDLLKQAEQIKTRADWESVVRPIPTVDQRQSSSAAVLKEPVSTRKLTTKEEILVLKASYLHGFKFPPWKLPPAPDEFLLKEGDELFIDTPDLPLSDLQEDVLDDWKRPADALPPPSWFAEGQIRPEPTMHAQGNIDLVQDAATDCSVVASLCAALRRLELGHARMAPSLLCPLDPSDGHTIISANGKYVSRLNFNGCFRKVVIDDRLPTSSTNQVIHVVDRRNPALLWPALVEKAYLKVRGGYDFPGSNSGTDLWILTGWIPEQIFLQSDDFDPDAFWRRVLRAFNYGDVLITMGTGKMSAQAELTLKLVGEHDYAVLDFREVGEQRLMLIKNPWCEGPTWRAHSDDGESRRAMDGEPGQSQPTSNLRDTLNADDKLSSGTFWMDLANVMQYFESIYLNWNPGLFSFRQDLHFSWDLSMEDTLSTGLRGQFASLHRHPQFSVTSKRPGAMWILLCRHFQNSIPADATHEEIESYRYGIDLSGHVSLAAYSEGGRRILQSDKAVAKGWFVDSPQILLKLDNEVGGAYTLVPTEQDLPTINHTFTLSAFCDSPITLAEAAPRYDYTQRLTAAWTKDTSGGNAHNPTYSINPQFSLTISQRTSIGLLLETNSDELNIHIRLMHGQGQRVHAVRSRDIVADSKDYRRGHCITACDALDPGTYTIICSTFEPHQLAPFTLVIESSYPTRVAPIPRDGAGRVRLDLGTAVLQPGQSGAALELRPQRPHRAYAVARPSDSLRSRPSSSAPLARSPVRLSLVAGRGPLSRVLASSGGYTDCIGGVRTGDLDLDRATYRRGGGLWLVLERLVAGPGGVEEGFALEMFVDQLDAVELGSWQVWDA